MKPGKRSGGGGGRSSSSSFSDRQMNQFRSRLESSTELDHSSTVDEIVDQLRGGYPDYTRLKRQVFKRFVMQTLASTLASPSFKRSNPRPPFIRESSAEEEELELAGDDSGRRRKKRARNEREEKLQQIEEAHVRKTRLSNGDVAASSEDDSDEDEVSTSEDAVYGEKLEPKFDLMKLMLRESYTEPKSGGKLKAAAAEQEKIVEMDIPGREKLKLLAGSRGPRPETLPDKAKSSVSKGGGVEMKRNEGPKFSDLGGMRKVLEELNKEVLMPLRHPWLTQWLGVKPMSGILLCGPPGCGKTTLANAIAYETGIPFYKLSATEVVTGVAGASEENIRELFSKAYKTAPSIVFIDEIDAIASKRENMQRDMERRIVTQLMTCMDQPHRLVQEADESSESRNSAHVLVIGATNRPDALDPALRRPGRFGREIFLGVPDENSRLEILSVLTRRLRLEGSFDLLKIARSTPGYVGADLAELADRAGNIAVNRILGEIYSTKEEGKEDFCRQPKKEEIDKYAISMAKDKEDLCREPEEKDKEKYAISMADFEEAVKVVQPSSKREGFSAVPNVKWENVGGLDRLRKELDLCIVRRIKHPENYEKFGIKSETGFLLYGPPGCGKTLIAKAVANEAGANFIYIKGPEILNKYVGESELAVRTLFARARTCSPCLLFFDEVDALTTRRGKEGGWVVERLLNQLLIELDGADQRQGVFVVGATNRPDVMDRAFLRPGRFGKLIYVAPPNTDERGLILKAIGRKYPIDASVDLGEIGKWKACENFSGADLAALMDEAAMAALEEYEISAESSDSSSWTIKETHFHPALAKIIPSVTEKQLLYYERFGERLKAPRSET